MSDQNFEWRYLENEKSFFKNLKTGFHNFESCFIWEIIIFYAGIPLNIFLLLSKVIDSPLKNRAPMTSDVVFVQNIPWDEDFQALVIVIIYILTIESYFFKSQVIYFKLFNCSAIGCTNRSTYNPNIRFYQIPSEKKNKPLRKQWLHNVCRAVQVPKYKSFYICSNHFKEDCFQRDLQVSTGVCTAEYDGTAEYGFWHFEHNFCSKWPKIIIFVDYCVKVTTLTCHDEWSWLELNFPPQKCWNLKNSW